VTLDFETEEALDKYSRKVLVEEVLVTTALKINITKPLNDELV